MPGEHDIVPWFAAARAVHISACLVLLSVFVFERFVVVPAVEWETPEIFRRWRRIECWLIAIALPLVLISGAVWFGQVAAGMSGLPIDQAIRGEVPGLVWNQTQFGELWTLRTIIYAVVLAIVPLALLLRPSGYPRAIATWLAMLVSAALVASLAWSGHGQTGGPPALHLGSDVLHLLVCGCWPAGLLPLALLLVSLRSVPQTQKQGPRREMVRRFSAMALASVALLIASGLVNAWSLVGSPSALISTPYGLALLVKLVLLAGMLSLGAVNLLRLKPRLMRNVNSDPTASRLLHSVTVEVLLGSALLAAVGVLGLLPPPAEHAAHHHHHVEATVDSG